MKVSMAFHPVPETFQAEVLPTFLGSPRQMIKGENGVYHFMEKLCKAYGGGLWEYYVTENGAFFMVPAGGLEAQYDACWAENYISETISGMAAGIISTLHSLYWVVLEDRCEKVIDVYDALLAFSRTVPEADKIRAALD